MSLFFIEVPGVVRIRARAVNVREGESNAKDSTEDGVLTQSFLDSVGSRIRVRRLGQRLTVQQLADRADVSRRLLTQIEHGQANPSLVAVTRIARSLGTDFTELIGDSVPRESALEVIRADDYLLVWTSEAGSTARLMVSTPGVRTADLWSWVLVPGDSYGGMPDPPGSFELFRVTAGDLTLTAGSEVVTVGAGESARLRSDRMYRYANIGSAPTEFFRTVALAR